MARPPARKVDATAPSVSITSTLDQAIDAMPADTHWLTVLDDDRSVRGIVAFSDVVRSYDTMQRKEARQISRVSANGGVLEVQVGKNSRLVGHRLNEEVLPSGVIVISVRRSDAMLLGLGAVSLAAGDQVMLLSRPDTTDQVRSLFDGEAVTAGRATAPDPGAR